MLESSVEGNPLSDRMSIPRPYKNVIDLLQRARLRPTRQRLALAKLLFENGDRHVTAEQLHAEAIASRISVSLATVYNTLHQFTHSGLLREVVVDSGRSYFDTNTSDHHHFFHEGNGELRDICPGGLDVGALPPLPDGTKISRVDVIIRLIDQAPIDKE